MQKEKTQDAERIKKRILAGYKKGQKPKELSEKFGVNINTIKSWIRREKVTPRPKADAEKTVRGASGKAGKDAPKKRRGAPPGNTNSVGNPGGGAPLGNVNAFKHGGYSPVYWDTLTDEEKSLLDNSERDTETLLLEEISLLSIRERRIMQRIQKLTRLDETVKSGMGQAVAGIVRTEEKREFDTPEDKELYESVQRVKIENGDLLPGHKYSLTTRTEATYDVIHRLEEALTRCQAQKQRCIQNLTELRLKRTDGGHGEISDQTRRTVEELIRQIGSNNTGNSDPDSPEPSG